MSRIDINISAEDQTDGDLVSRLVTAALTNNGFEDVTSMTHNTHVESEEDVIVAMRGLNPSIFASEITVAVSDYESELPDAVDDSARPGDETFPDPDSDEEG